MIILTQTLGHRTFCVEVRFYFGAVDIHTRTNTDLYLIDDFIESHATTQRVRMPTALSELRVVVHAHRPRLLEGKNGIRRTLLIIGLFGLHSVPRTEARCWEALTAAARARSASGCAVISLPPLPLVGRHATRAGRVEDLSGLGSGLRAGGTGGARAPRAPPRPTPAPAPLPASRTQPFYNLCPAQRVALHAEKHEARHAYCAQLQGGAHLLPLRGGTAHGGRSATRRAGGGSASMELLEFRLAFVLARVQQPAQRVRCRLDLHGPPPPLNLAYGSVAYGSVWR
jgi:hypothetical protein